MSREELILLVTAEINKVTYLSKEHKNLLDILVRLEDTTGFDIFEFHHLQVISTLVQKETRRVASLNTYSF
jgi:hypothetical protein